MLRTNSDYAIRVSERLKAKNPELYSQVSVAKIRLILNYVTKNIAYVVLRHRHAQVTNFLNIYPDSKQLFEYRKKCIKRFRIRRWNLENNKIK